MEALVPALRLKAGRRRLVTASSGRKAVSLFPPGRCAKWEAVPRLLGSHGLVLWRPCRPKWHRPRRTRGEPGVEAEDPIMFSILSSGSFLQSPGTGLYFLVCMGPFLLSVVLLLYE
jgi:hypothetical protein